LCCHIQLAPLHSGRRGQYFFLIEETGHVFFHREVAPWGLRSQTRIPGGWWTHVAVTFGAGRSKIYVNGTLRAGAHTRPPVS
jgi:hypothetical protein